MTGVLHINHRTFWVSRPMEEKEALMTATFFSCRYGRMPVSVLSARLLWQYDSTASTVPMGTLQQRVQHVREVDAMHAAQEPQLVNVAPSESRPRAVLSCCQVSSICTKHNGCETLTGQGRTSRCPAAAL